MSDASTSNSTALTSTSSITTNSNSTSDDSKKPDIKIEKRSDNAQKKNWWQDKNRNNNNNKTRLPRENVFKGTIADMNGHTFQCHGEASHASQFSKTCDELQGYLRFSILV